MRNTEPDKKESWKKRRARQLGRHLFYIYLAVLLYFLFFANWYGHAPGSSRFYRINLKPFREIRRFIHARSKVGAWSVFLNLFGNVIGFIPFGFFLPVMSRRLRNVFLVTALGFLMSTSVEIIQMLMRSGSCDIDDVILNTAGTLIGYIMFIIFDRIFRKAEKRYGR